MMMMRGLMVLTKRTVVVAVVACGCIAVVVAVAGGEADVVGSVKS